jgi:hypothetical protein
LLRAKRKRNSVKQGGFVLRKYLILFVVLTFLGLSGCDGCHKENSKIADKLPPTVPNGIAITAASSSDVKVSWKPSADNSGEIMGYKVYRNGKYLKSVKTTSVLDANLPPKVKFCYRISAYDAAGNESGKSTEVCALL